MNKVTRYFMKRPTLFWSLMVGIALLGGFSFTQMPKLEDPLITIKQAMVVVSYPGASAHEVELEVAIPLEDELRSLPDIRQIMTDCHDGMAMVTVEFDFEVPQTEMEQYYDLVRRKVSDYKMSMPSGCYDPVVIDDVMDIYGIFYSLQGEGYSYAELNKYAKFIRKELLTVEGVKRVTIGGNRAEVIDITIDKDLVTRNGMIPTQIMSSLQSAGSHINAGSFIVDSDKIRFDVNGACESEDDIREMLIRTVDGNILRLGDVATVERGYSSPHTSGFFVHGEEALAICVAMEESAIVPDVGKLVDKKLEEAMNRLPLGLETEKIFFQPDKVSTAISSFMLNLLQSVLIVIVVLVIFMGMRSGVIIGFGLVMTIGLSFLVLNFLGTTLQRISLGAFIVAMGMLVDNSVVIMDGILVDKKKGLPRDKYLFRIGKQTALPLLGATVVAACTFVCIYLSPGTVAEYAGDLFVVLCVSLLSSWFLALVQVPICADKWLPSGEEKKVSGDSKITRKMQGAVRRIARLFIGHKWVTLACAVAALALSGFGMTKVKNVFFPDFDYKQFVVECFLPEQTDPEFVKATLLEMSKMLESEYDEVERVTASMASAPVRYCLARPMTSGGNCYGELLIDCADFKTVKKMDPIVRDRLRGDYPDVSIRTRKYNFSINSSHKVEVEFTGPDPAVLRDLSAQAEAIMRECPYVDQFSVGNNWKPTGKTVTLSWAESNSLSSGISRSDIGNAVQAAGDGMTVGAFIDDDETLLVNLMVRENDGSRIANPADIPVWASMNFHLSDDALGGLATGATDAASIQDDMFKSVPLGSLVDDIHVSWDENYIYRRNGQRAIEAECDPNIDLWDGTTAKVTSWITPAIESIERPEGYGIRWVGENQLSDEAISNLMSKVPMVSAVIILVLLLLFNDWRKVLLVIVCLPFVICGIVPALLVFRTPFTFMAIIGTMGLMGMMIKNVIVLLDEIGRLLDEEHLEPYTAVVEATVSRTRPVLMASLTTILGMFPLISDPMYSSLALAIMGGLAAGTVITLLLLPLFYCLMYNIKKPQTK